MRHSISVLALLASATFASAQSQAFYFHQSVAPVPVPGGTSATYLDDLEPTGATVQVLQTATIANGATAMLPRFVAVGANANQVGLLGPIVFAHVNLSANQLMRQSGVGCADITVTLEHLDATGVATPIGTGTLLSAEVPQGGAGGAAGFDDFVIEIESATNRDLAAGEAIAATIAITNRCSANRKVNLAFDATSAETRIDFITPDALVLKCIDTADKSLAKYVKTRLVTIDRCKNGVNDGSLPPLTDCLTEPKTADKLAKAVVKLSAALAKKCAGGLLIDPPPAGFGIAACPGLLGACAFPVASLDDGTRGNDNDYVDCLTCLGDHATDTMLGVQYRSTSVAPLAETISPCQEDAGKLATAFEVKALKALQKCRKGLLGGKVEGSCPDPKTTTKIDAAAAKITTSLAKHCTDAVITDADPAGLGLTSCPGPSAGCQGPVAGVADEATCLGCSHRFLASCLFSGTVGKSAADCQ